MAYHLNKRRSEMHRVDSVINRILIFGIATGALTSLVDVIALIFSIAQPQSLAFMAPILIQTRLYANSLLTFLNIRKVNTRVHNGVAIPQGRGIDLPTIRFTRPLDPSAMSEESGRQTVSTQNFNIASIPPTVSLMILVFRKLAQHSRP
ncbi:hypothetical protein PAXRUDRAFT_829934 [Paxillus rubicundulus Ve08.2h10]|uniref:DUF6534 domain-containing protein n=1 Tax=Paxillus rubicundulus Ve08.2h10 TaxID=930991 RepID=A0A0D0DLY7_9AGAM|nr:hypothetical protein PAXRUDRAFT_829934 [Paxillus rubicundulus Ve08.2h10]